MLKNISLFVSKQLAILVVLATLFSLYYPQVGSNLVKTSWVVYILGIIMFGMGLNVKASDFKELFIRPKFVLIGIGAQFIIMPLIAYIFSISRLVLQLVLSLLEPVLVEQVQMLLHT